MPPSSSDGGRAAFIAKDERQEQRQNKEAEKGAADEHPMPLTQPLTLLERWWDGRERWLPVHHSRVLSRVAIDGGDGFGVGCGLGGGLVLGGWVVGRGAHCGGERARGDDSGERARRPPRGPTLLALAAALLPLTLRLS